MLSVAWVIAKPIRLKLLTGLDLGGFLQLAQQCERSRISQADECRSAPRIRRSGGGRRGKLNSPEQRLLLILTYIRHYPVQEFIGILFGISQERACEQIAILLVALQRALGHELVLPKRPPSTGEWLLAHVPGLSYVFDGFDRPIQRPCDSVLQKEKYSGKKKCHSIKNTLVIDKRTGIAIGLGATHPGSRHDKSIIERDRMVLPSGSVHRRDTRYQGLELTDSLAIQPTKKPKGNELTAWQRFDNTCISMERVAVEHAIRGIKISRIAKDTLRHTRVGSDDLVVERATGLYNYRLVA
jgi:DDE superfamily endonuclease/Helix-turn-helix of DDE superfamily endonuclease